MLQLPNALIIVGTDRNAGKTTFASKVIKNISSDFPVIGVKISPHFHELAEDEEVIVRKENYVIVSEKNTARSKDSGRFLHAGASKVFYLQVWDENLEGAFHDLLKIIGSSDPVVIESGWLRNFVEPGLFFIINRKGNTEFKQSTASYRQLPHIWTEFDGVSFNPSPDKITWTGDHWMF